MNHPFFIAKTSRISPFPTVNQVCFPSTPALRCLICNPDHRSFFYSFPVSNWICILLFCAHGPRTPISSYDPNIMTTMLSCRRWLHIRNSGSTPHLRATDRVVETTMDVEKQSFAYHLDHVIRFVRRTCLYCWRAYLPTYIQLFAFWMMNVCE